MASRFVIRSSQFNIGHICRPGVIRFRACLRQRSTAAFVWGAGDGGQLGTGDTESRLKPIRFPVADGEKVMHIGCGHGFTFVSEKNPRRMWMSTKIGALKQLKRRESHSPNTQENVPVNVSLPVSHGDTQVAQISCGRDHVAVFTDNEGVFVAGSNNLGQCGVRARNAGYPNQFCALSEAVGQIKQVAAGLDHSLLLTSEGRIFSCGMGADGQTGLGHFVDEWNVGEVEGDTRGVKIKQIATSADCCLAVSDEGEVFSWGNNEYGQLAQDSEEPQAFKATRAALLHSLGPVAQVAAAGANCAVLTASGDVYTWGFGVLGRGSRDHTCTTPKKVAALQEIGESVVQLHCGLEQTAVITETGLLFVWGRGSYGRLGNGKTTDEWTPVQVRLPGRVLEVSCGVDHMGAVVELEQKSKHRNAT